jgi:hypothetical protein
MVKNIISKVWRIAGIFGRVTPGVLIWENGYVTFITQEETKFKVPLAELKEVKWPFLRMGLGFNTIVHEKKYKFSFTKPNPSAEDLNDSVTDQFIRSTSAGKLLDSIGTLANIGADKATTKIWREILKDN